MVNAAMREYKLYMEDDLGNRVVVDRFYPGEMGRGLKESDRSAEDMLAKLVAGCDALSNITRSATVRELAARKMKAPMEGCKVS
jgi:hypothetical protein